MYINIFLAIILLAGYVFLLGVNQKRNKIRDDAFITYRYAYNLTHGNNLVYNIDEAVLGTTSPGYALLLAIGSLIIGTDDIPSISLGLNFIAILILMVCLMLSVHRLSEGDVPLTILAPLIVLASIMTLDAIVYGMEGPVYLALIAISLTLIIYKKWIPAYLMAGLLLWIRPEGAFLIGLLSIDLVYKVIRKQIIPGKFLLYGTVLTLPGIAYFATLLIFYNTLLPQSVVAKLSGLYPVPPFEQFGIITQYITSPLTALLHSILNNILTQDMGLGFHLSMLAIALFLIIVGSMKLIKLDKNLWVIPVLLFMTIIFYASRSTKIFEWYHAHYHIFSVLLITLGGGQILNSLVKGFRLPISSTTTSIITLLVLAIPSVWITPYSVWAQTPNQPHHVTGRVEDYYDLLQVIGDDIPAGATIALPEIGYLGYYMPDNRILDTAGLVSPEILDYLPVPPEDQLHPYLGVIPKEAIYDLQPDIIITLDLFAEDGLYRTTWFDEQYTSVFVIEGLSPFGERVTDLRVLVHTNLADDIVIDGNTTP